MRWNFFSIFSLYSHLTSLSYFTREKAREGGITGWCRNTIDNKVSVPNHVSVNCANHNEQVEGEAQGSQAALDKFLKHVDDGPRHARVVQLTTEGRDVIETETVFEVRR